MPPTSVSIGLYSHITARKTAMKNRSSTTVTELLVRNWRMCSSSRTRATVSPTRRASK